MFTVDSAVLVGCYRALGDFIAPRIRDLQLERLSGKARPVGVVLRLADPELELHRLAGTVDGPIGDREDLDRVILLVVVVPVPGIGKAQKGQSPCAGLGGDEPGVIVAILRRIDEHLACRVAVIGRAGRFDLCFTAAGRLHVIAEQLDVDARQWLARHGVGHVVVRAVGHRFFDDRGVGDPQHDAAGVAVGHRGGDQIRAGFG